MKRATHLPRSFLWLNATQFFGALNDLAALQRFAKLTPAQVATFGEVSPTALATPQTREAARGIVRAVLDELPDAYDRETYDRKR